MPQRHKLEGFGRRYLLVNLAYFLPACVWLWLTWRSFAHSSFGPEFYISLAGFLACIVFGMWLDVFRLRRFRCLECGTHLPFQPKKPGEPLNYHCSKCDIIWETDLHQPED